jgi:hypothetical protein
LAASSIASTKVFATVRQPVVIFDRRISRVIEQSRWRGLEAFAIFDERSVELFAIGGCLLVGER